MISLPARTRTLTVVLATAVAGLGLGTAPATASAPQSIVLPPAPLPTDGPVLPPPVSPPLPTPAPTPTPAGVPFGPDVSRWQHPNGKAIDWAAVRAGGSSFVIIKATEGGTYTNPYFADDAAGARANGLAVGAYHYARPALPISTAADQARRFAATVGDVRRPATIAPVLDLETSGGLTSAQLITWAQVFTETLRQASGRTPIVYTYPSFWQVQMANTSAFTRYPLWLAAYRSTPPAPVGGWPAWTIWQHSATSRIAGVSGNIDMNRFAGDAAAFTAFTDGTLASPVTVVAPSAPLSVKAAAGPGSATVRWVPADDGGALPTSYTVTASPGGRQASVPGTATTATVTGLTQGSRYTFTVSATNVAGSSPQSRASAAVAAGGAVPAAPYGLAAQADKGRVALSWTAGATPATSYDVARCSPAPCTPTVVVGSSTTTSYVDTAVVGGVAHSYAVAAVNQWGSSARSAPADATPLPMVDALALPAAPTVTGGSGTLTVRWKAVQYAARYQVRRCTTPACVPGGNPVATLTAPVTRWSQKVPAGVTYTYAVTAVAGPITSPQSPAASGSSLIPQLLRVTSVPASPKPGQPVTLTVRLTRADTRAALAGRTLTLAVSPAHGSRPAPVRLVTSSSGVATHVVRTQVSAGVSVRSSATDLLTRVAKARVQVKPVLTSALSALAVPRTAKVTLTGQTSASFYGERVFRQVLVGRTWRSAGSTPITRTGTYRFTVPAAAKPGRQSMRVLIGRTARHQNGTSPVVVLTRR